MIYDRMHLLVVCGLLDYDQEPHELVEALLVDLVRVFVKQEPHKWSKVIMKRWRLIASVSTIDSGIERAVYQKRSKLEIANWEEIPSKPGMGGSDEDLGSLGRQLSAMLSMGSLLDSDVSGWDWRRKKFQAFSRVYVDALHFDVHPDSDLFKVMWNREVAATNPVFCFSSGKLVTLRNNGIMLSGRFITSMGNSKERVYGSALVGTHAIAMGDDCNETLCGLSEKEAIERYDSQGYTGIVEYQTTDNIDGTIFCSTRFYPSLKGYLGEPVHWHRTLFRLISKGLRKVPFAEIAQYLYEIRNLRVDQEQMTREIFSKYLVDVEGPATQ